MKQKQGRPAALIYGATNYHNIFTKINYRDIMVLFGWWSTSESPI